jgi:hypothetical protein
MRRSETELIEADIRQSPALPGFSFFGRTLSWPRGDPRVIFLSVVLRGAVLMHLKL